MKIYSTFSSTFSSTSSSVDVKYRLKSDLCHIKPIIRLLRFVTTAFVTPIYLTFPVFGDLEMIMVNLFNKLFISLFSFYNAAVAYTTGPHDASGVITPNQIPLTTILTYTIKNVTEAEFQTIGPLYLHAVWYLPFTNSPRKHTVTYRFCDLQEVHSGNRQIHTKCQLQYLHPSQISTSGKCHCVIIHQTTKATEYIG